MKSIDRPIVLFVDSVHPRVERELSQLGFDCRDMSQVRREEILSEIPKATGLVIRSRYRMDESFLENAAQLQWIARSGVGMENIDLDYCEKRGIKAFNAAGANADAVGEHVIGMLLSLFNKLNSADAEIREGLWRREANRGIELGARTVGIIGYGHTGRSLAKKLSGFGTKVLAYDKYRPVDGPYAHAVPLERIKAECDVLSFHVPLTKESHYFFDRAFLQDMKHPFYLVNASRGSVCQTSAMLLGLESKKILGLCLDVFEEEGSDLDLHFKEGSDLYTLLSYPNTRFSPHVAGWSTESYENLAKSLIEQIKVLHF